MRVPHLIGALAVLASAVLLLMPVPEGVSAELLRGAGAVVLGLGLWVSAVVPEYLTSIIFFFVVVIFAVAPPDIVFSGFHASAAWLVFGGLVMGTAAHSSGLGGRIAELTLRHIPASYLGVAALLALLGLLLGFLIPTGIGRVSLLVPMAVALCERLGFVPGSRGYTGLVLSAGTGTVIPPLGILPASLPSVVMAGAAESIYGIRISYFEYFALNFPVMSIMSLVVLVGLISLLYGEPPQAVVSQPVRTPWSARQRRLTWVLAAAVALWMTDSLHGVSPAWVALGAGLVCLLPGVGVLPPKAMAEQINYGPWFFIVGIIGLGAVVTHTGLGQFVADAMLANIALAPGEDPRSYAVLAVFGAVIGIIATLGAAPAIMTPLAESLATATGWTVESVLMVQAVNWFLFPFPYQVPPLVLAMALGGLGLKPLFRLLILFMLVGAVMLVPLHFLWSRLLGYAG